ncbi:MAG: FAD-binding oxidoreductase [Planctomycetota bacterium]
MTARIHRGPDAEGLTDLLSDESRMLGAADGIAQPADEDALAAILQACAESGECVTVSSALTGITGAGVPQGGVLVNLARMDRIVGLRREGGVWYVRCQPGVVLSALREAVASGAFAHAETWDAESRALLDEFRDGPAQVFSPDPTETSATLGGMAACNASGARSFHYGPMRAYVEGVRGLLVDGRRFALRRGEVTAAADRTFRLPLEDGSAVEGRLPAYDTPRVKNAAGYFAADGMDLVDLFIGSEGTLGILTELEVRLTPAPPEILGLVAFLPDEDAALRFVRSLRGQGEAPLPERPLAVEFFDHRALDLLRALREEESGGDVPEIPAA